MNKHEKFEYILDECLTRVLDHNEPVDIVVDDYPWWKDRLKGEIDAAVWLHDQGEHLSPRPGYIISTQKHLESQLLVSNLQSQFRYSAYRGRGYLTRFTLIVLTVLTIFLGGGGVALAAVDSLPGDALYSVRMSTENIWLALTLQPTREAQLHLQYANEHLIACAILVSQGRNEDAMTALRNYDRHMAGAGRLVPVLSKHGNLDAEAFFINFNRIYLQDIGTIQVLLPGEF
jgi:hypothetical protein